MPNYLSFDKKVQVLNALVEGSSICSIARMTGVNKRTILRLLCEAGERAKEVMDREIVNVKAQFVQCDEIWCYVAKKQKNCTGIEKLSGLVGDQYVFVAMDSDSAPLPNPRSFSLNHDHHASAQCFIFRKVNINVHIDQKNLDGGSKDES